MPHGAEFKGSWWSEATGGLQSSLEAEEWTQQVFRSFRASSSRETVRFAALEQGVVAPGSFPFPRSRGAPWLCSVHTGPGPGPGDRCLYRTQRCESPKELTSPVACQLIGGSPETQRWPGDLPPKGWACIRR